MLVQRPSPGKGSCGYLRRARVEQRRDGQLPSSLLCISVYVLVCLLAGLYSTGHRITPGRDHAHAKDPKYFDICTSTHVYGSRYVTHGTDESWKYLESNENGPNTYHTKKRRLAQVELLNSDTSAFTLRTIGSSRHMFISQHSNALTVTALITRVCVMEGDRAPMN